MPKITNAATSSCILAAQYLREHKSEVIELWEARARQRLPAAQGKSHFVLLDSLPLFLDEPINSLDEQCPKLEVVRDVGEVHAEQRSKVGGYTLQQVQSEYAILRQVLFELLDRHFALAPLERNIILDSIEEGRRAAVDEFTSIVRAHEKEAYQALKLSEEKLASERHKFESVVQASPAAMALWCGPDMIFEMVNPQYQALFPGRKLVGMPFLEALPEFEGQPFIDIYRNVLETGETFTGTEVLARHRRTASGPIEEFYYDFVYVRVNDVRGDPYGVYDHATDVTERVLTRRNREENSHKLNQAVEELHQERDLRMQFVNTVTHDLRNPIAAAKTSAQIIARHLDRTDRIPSLTARIIVSLNRADELIGNLLDANRIRAGQGLPIEKSRCDLAEIAREVCEEFTSLHGTRFRLVAPRSIEGIWGCQEIRRMLENLVSNAMKYGDPNGLITVRTELRTSDLAELAVHNQGPMIPPEQQAQIFQPFSRAGRGEASPQKGWGLGLTLVRGIAEAHGGSVRVQSNEMSGTEFTVELPREAPPDAGSPA